MIKKREIVINRFGFEFEIEKFYSSNHSDWLVDIHNAAKMILYKDATSLLAPNEEALQLSAIIAIIKVKEAQL